MNRRLCIIHANCQGNYLHQILASTQRFADLFTIRKYTNYQEEYIPEEEFSLCSLLLYQQLADKWHDSASSALLARLPLGAQALKIPNMFFKGYWPLWTNKTFMAYGDIFWEYLAEHGYSVEEIVHLGTHAPVADLYDLDRLAADSVDRERAKEVGCVVETVDLVQELWRKEQLFTTVNHPGSRLLLHVADGILQALDLGSVPASVREAFAHSHSDDFEQPLYPQVGAHFGLPFISPGRGYHIYGKKLTFAEYCRCYSICRQERVPDFAAFMHYISTDDLKTRAA